MDIRKKCIILGRWAAGATACFAILVLFAFGPREDGFAIWRLVITLTILLTLRLAIYLLERDPRLHPDQDSEPVDADR